MPTLPGIAWLTAIGHLIISAFYAKYPLYLDRTEKQARIRLILKMNIVAALITSGVTTYLLWPITNFFTAIDNFSFYFWVGIAIFLAHGLLVEAPATFIGGQFDRQTKQLLTDLSALASGILYGSDWERSLEQLGLFVEINEVFLKDYGLWGLSTYLTQSGGSQPRRDVALFLLERVSNAQSALATQAARPFQGLNTVLSVTGLGVIIGLAVKLLLEANP